jgi:hypothetical protein
MADPMDSIFPKKQEGVYIFRDPFEKVTETKVTKNAGILVEGELAKPKKQETYQGVTKASDLPSMGSTGATIVPETFSTGPKIEGSGAPIIQEPLPETVQDVIKSEGLKDRQLNAIMAGARFFADVLNANSAYNAASGQAQLNILQARNQAADALYRGRQARIEAESEGRQAGESALLAMAIQGQDVSGSAVQKIQGSYEAMGVFNGMREEINAVREALGYELQEVAYDYQIRNAEIARNSAIIGSGLNFAASSVGTGIL